ncbi:MAG: site-specific DNA-methyltransferase [Planctomycetaceae bacterium]|nr:site-specific DNA-methyltransferase [Planctomycetaceae bacterium]
MIYIDPPYNTGNDFVYPDDFSEPLENYLALTGQKDALGRKLSANAETAGRFHANWLNMMFPRLYIAKDLLKEDGIIFISIDEKEVTNLKHLCNEIFGEENFVSTITLLCNPKGRSQDKHFATNHEYIMVYSKVTLPKGVFSIGKEEEQIEVEYPEEDECGKYRLIELRNTHREFGRHNRKKLYYPFYVNEDGEISLTQNDDEMIEIFPIWNDGFEGCWTWDTNKARKDSELLVGRNIKGRWKVFRKSYANGSERMLKTILIEKEFYTEKGQKEFNALFKTKAKIFPSPKSPHLLLQLMKTSLEKNDVVLDFFAGSATTAHAVLELNKEDGGNRCFICVQLPEPLDIDNKDQKIGAEFCDQIGKPRTIAEISKERIRRVIKKIKDEQSKEKQENPLFDNQQSEIENQQIPDLGFRVFKLDRSNFRVWDSSPGTTTDQLLERMAAMTDPLRDGTKPEELLYELLLKAGFPLSTRVKIIKLAGKTVYSVENDAVLLCLEDEVTKALIDEVIKLDPVYFYCLDSAFKKNDQLKVNTIQQFDAHNQEREKEAKIVFRTI